MLTNDKKQATKHSLTIYQTHAITHIMQPLDFEDGWVGLDTALEVDVGALLQRHGVDLLPQGQCDFRRICPNTGTQYSVISLQAWNEVGFWLEPIRTNTRFTQLTSSMQHDQ